LMTQRHNLQPVADNYLTEEGSRMTRSAAKRGLIKPHPDNPNMRANVDPIYDESTRRADAEAHLRYASLSHPTARAESEHTYGPQEVVAATRRLFGRGKKRQEPPAHMSFRQLGLF
jgi:hypothetical protein